MPVDGLVLCGKSHADESMLTGEAEPVLKAEGDAVIGGTMNLGGTLQVCRPILCKFFLKIFDVNFLTNLSPCNQNAHGTLLGSMCEVVLGDAVQVRATRVGKDTALAQIVKLVEAAQMSKAPIQAFADYVSSIFVPVVVTVAMITCLCWCAGNSSKYESFRHLLHA